MAMDITEWLAALGLGVYAQAFRDNDIDAETLPSLTADDLKEIGVTSVGHRRRILAAIGSLGTNAPAVAALAPAAQGPEGERRQVTVLFADIAGFTALSAEMDAEQVHAVLSHFFEQVDRIIAEFGGRIDKHIGDCAMAVFGVPVAHGDDVRRAVAAALAVHAAMPAVSQSAGRTLAAHVGIASGEVVANRTGSSRFAEYTVTGDTVNLASRLTGLARDGETIASTDIVSTLADAVDAEFAGSQPVKGLAAPVDIWRVRGLREVTTSDRPLVGRRAEMAQCEASLSAARDGESGAILYVRGEAGIGKSSLATETLRVAERLGFTAVRAAVFAFGTGLDRDPLRVLALALLRTLVPAAASQAIATLAAAQELSEGRILALKDLAGADLAHDERRLSDAMTAGARLAARGEALAGLALAAGSRAPLLVVVEDVHWADAVTLQGLAALAQKACGGSRTVMLMTSRLEADPIQVLQPSMSGPPLVLIELGRLREQDAKTLAASLLGSAGAIIDQCVARAAGNPLFLEQLIRHARTGGLASAIPGSIRSVVMAQIDTLAGAEKAALQAASVLGNQFAIEALRRLLGRPDWSADALIANRLVLPGTSALHFAHALIRDAAYASILNPERRRLHRAAAEWFAGRDSALRAEHLARAEDASAVAAWLAAADEQVANYRLDEALAFLERAAGMARAPEERFDIDIRQGDLLTEIGRSADALAAYERALLAAPDAAGAALAKLGKAGTLRLLDRNEEALALLDQAEPAFASAGRHVELARLEHLRGNLLFPLGRNQACEAAHKKALEHARRCGSAELEARALGGLGDAAYAAGRYVTAHQRFCTCIELARRHGFGRIEVANAPMVAAYSDNADASAATAERAIAMAATARQPRAELTGHHGAMVYELWRARPDAVAAHFERAQDIVRQIGAHRFRALNLTLMGEAHRQLGERERALALHDEALAIARQGGMSYIGAIVLGHRALAAFDDAELRRDSLREGELTLAQGSVAHNAAFFYCFAIESCLRANDWGEARRLADCFATTFASERVPLIEFLVERGRLLAELGDRRPTGPLRHALASCRAVGRAMGYMLFLQRLDEALVC